MKGVFGPAAQRADGLFARAGKTPARGDPRSRRDHRVADAHAPLPDAIHHRMVRDGAGIDMGDRRVHGQRLRQRRSEHHAGREFGVGFVIGHFPERRRVAAGQHDSHGDRIAVERQAENTGMAQHRERGHRLTGESRQARLMRQRAAPCLPSRGLQRQKLFERPRGFGGRDGDFDANGAFLLEPAAQPRQIAPRLGRQGARERSPGEENRAFVRVEHAQGAAKSLRAPAQHPRHIAVEPHHRQGQGRRMRMVLRQPMQHGVEGALEKATIEQRRSQRRQRVAPAARRAGETAGTRRRHGAKADHPPGAVDIAAHHDDPRPRRAGEMPQGGQQEGRVVEGVGLDGARRQIAPFIGMACRGFRGERLDAIAVGRQNRRAAIAPSTFGFHAAPARLDVARIVICARGLKKPAPGGASHGQDEAARLGRRRKQTESSWRPD
jgi:hypothetical protein